MMERPRYRRLPGGSGVWVRKTLWLASDHALRVRSNVLSQEYRRYYFADIQAIAVTQFHNRSRPALYTAAALLAALAGALIATGHPGWAFLPAAISAGLALFAWRLPDCRCSIQTFLGVEQLPSLGRMANAGQALATLREEIEKAQGALNKETLDKDALAARLARRAPELVKPEKGALHATLFVALAAGSVALTAAALFPGHNLRPAQVVAACCSYAVLLFSLVAVVKQRGTDLAPPVRRIAAASLWWWGIQFVATFALTMYLTMRAATGNRVVVAVTTDPALTKIQFLNALVFLMLAVCGWIALRRSRRARAAREAQPPALTAAPRME